MHIVSNSGQEHYMTKLAFKTTNNDVEYKVLVARRSRAEGLGASEVEVKANSQVVVNQVL